MENKDLVHDITQTCQDIINKETLNRVDTHEEYQKALEEAKKNPKANQEILQEDATKLFYVQNKRRVIIELFKETTEDQIIGKGNEALEEIRRVTKRNNGSYLSLQPGDAQIFLYKSLSRTREETQNRICRAWILGEECFLQKETVGETEIVKATQDDLIWILEGLKKLV